jgi:membrane fusion protein (multidrug efflux system)
VVLALQQGPDYRVARARERAANKVLSSRRGAYLPTLNLSAAHSRFDVKLFPGASNVSSLTITASLPIWDNGQRELNILRARADRDVARAVRTDLELAAQRDVTEAYDGYETARAAVALASEGVVVAGENYRVQNARYKGGVTTVLDLLTAQNGLSDAEAGLVQARYAARLARGDPRDPSGDHQWRPSVTFVRLVLLGALSLSFACKKAKPAAGGGEAGGFAFPVEVAAARQDTVVDAILATGEVEAIQSAELRPDVEGRVVEILMHEGSEVARGDALFRIDDQELKAQVARAEAERDLAEQALGRTKQLIEQNAASASDLERADATARSSRASLDLLKVRLARTTVRAPFAGIVGQRYKSLGDYVTTSDRLVIIQTVDPERVAFSVPERYAGSVRRGQKVTFRVAAIPGEEFTGNVDFVSPAVQLPARTLLVKALVPNGRRQLQAGMFAEARLATAVRPKAVVVPEESVVALQGNYFVWVVEQGKVARRAVVLGVRSPGEVEINSGVDAGDQVVVGGLELLQEGAPVTPTLVERGKVEKKE